MSMTHILYLPSKILRGIYCNSAVQDRGRNHNDGTIDMKVSLISSV